MVTPASSFFRCFASLAVACSSTTERRIRPFSEASAPSSRRSSPHAGEQRACPIRSCKGRLQSDTALFDDFEDGDNKPFKGFEREGWWWAATDTTADAKLLPEKGTLRPNDYQPPRLETTPRRALRRRGAKGAALRADAAWTNGGIVPVQRARLQRHSHCAPRARARSASSSGCRRRLVPTAAVVQGALLR